MTKQAYHVEERVHEYNDVLEETEELIKVFVTSIKTAEKKQK